jgi:hypothetical protein
MQADDKETIKGSTLNQKDKMQTDDKQTIKQN